MENKYIDQILIKQDDRYTLAVTKDHNSGVVVQVARMNPTHVRGDNGAVYKGHEPVVMWQYVIPLGTKNKSGELEFRDLQSIDADIKIALARGQQYAQKCIQSETGLDNLLAALDKEVNK